MSISRQARRGGLLALALAVAALAIFGWSHSTAQAGGNGAMAVDCDASQSGVQADCQYDPGEPFTIQLHVTEPPAGGYEDIQMKANWVNGVINYQPRATAADEGIWPRCTIAARNPEPPTGDPPMLYACVQFPPTAVTDVEAIIEMDFVCKDSPENESPEAGLDPNQVRLFLVPRPGDEQQGSHFIVAANPIEPDTLDSAVITCEEGEEPGATPTPTPGAPSVTPGPEGACEITAGATTVGIDGTSALTFTVTDTAGDPAEGVDVTFSIVGPEGTEATLDPLTDTSDASGEVSTIFTAGSAAETVQVRADCGDFGSQVVDLVVSPSAPPSVGAGSFGDESGGRVWLLMGILLAAAAAGLTLFGWRYSRAR